MVDNKSKTPLIRHIQKKYITHEDEQYNTRATHSYNIAIFIRDIFFLYMSFGTFSYYIFTNADENIARQMIFSPIQIKIIYKIFHHHR